MQLAARPLITAGVALAGASIIAAAPVAQHLPEIQAAAVRLASTEESITDLFSGAANNVAGLVPAAAAATDPYFVNPLQTWVDVFTDTVASLQTMYDSWSQVPAVLAQQVAANWIDYASIYVGSYQVAANAAVTYFLSYTYAGGQPTSFPAFMAAIPGLLEAGDIQKAFQDFGNAIAGAPLQDIFQNLESILLIPVFMSQNLASLMPYLFYTNAQGVYNSLLVMAGASVILNILPGFWSSLGGSLQTAYDAFGAGDLLGGMLNLLNTPGAVVGQVLNGGGPYALSDAGLLAPLHGEISSGLFPVLVNLLPQAIAPHIVAPGVPGIGAPGAPNIADGGSLAAEWAAFVGQLTNFSPSAISGGPVGLGWPSPNMIINNLINTLQQTFIGGSNSAAAAADALPAGLSGVAPSIAADLSGAAGALGPDLAHLMGDLGVNLASTLPGIILGMLHF